MGDDNSAAAKSARTRSLIISVMMSMLVAVVVFAVATLAFVAPQFGVVELQLVAQKHQIQALSGRVAELEAAVQAKPTAPAPVVVAAAKPAAP